MPHGLELESKPPYLYIMGVSLMSIVVLLIGKKRAGQGLVFRVACWGFWQRAKR